MFEVLDRDGWGRLGIWSKEGSHKNVETPAIASIGSKRFPLPKTPTLVLTREQGDRDAPTIVSQGSLYSPTEAAFLPNTFAVLPSTFNYPITFPVPTPTEDDEGIPGQNAFIVDGSSVPIPGQDISARELCVLSNANAYASNPLVFTSMITTIRADIGYQRLLYTPGLGEPADLALLCYIGCDIFDETPLLFAARKGVYLTTDGNVTKQELEMCQRRPCPCPICIGTRPLGYESLLEHNRNVASAEISNIKNAIAGGRLRELVEIRASTSPKRMETLRYLDMNHYDFMEPEFPIRRRGSLSATTNESLLRPDIRRFRRRFLERYRPPEGAKVLLLLPCSQRKPYSSSPSHRKFKEVIRSCYRPSLVHEVMVTSPLGIVPRELEAFYPAMHYDIPVIGKWYPQEKEMILGQLNHLLDRGNYSKVICHLGSDSDFLFDSFSEMERTSVGHPTSHGSLRCLKETLDGALSSVETNKKSDRKVEDLRSLARFQFTGAGEMLMEGAFVTGSRHNRKIYSKGQLVATLSSNKGTLSLTMEGGRILASQGVYRVHIEDFHPKGNVFAIGVSDCDKEIRCGDDVVVVHGDQVRGVGRADMSAGEMVASRRGKAVDIRHALRGE